MILSHYVASVKVFSVESWYSGIFYGSNDGSSGVIFFSRASVKGIYHLPHICPCGLKLDLCNSHEVMMRKECFVCAWASVCACHSIIARWF